MGLFSCTKQLSDFSTFGSVASSSSDSVGQLISSGQLVARVDSNDITTAVCQYIEVTVQNSDGKTASTKNALSISVGGMEDTRFYKNPDCTEQVSNYVIAEKTNSTDVYFIGDLSSGYTDTWTAQIEESTGKFTPAQIQFEVLAGATALSVGKDHACASVEGALLCWGSGRVAQNGFVDYRSISYPGEVYTETEFSSYPVQNFDAGYYGTCAVHAEEYFGSWGHTIKCLGSNSYMDAGSGDTAPVADQKLGCHHELVDYGGRVDYGQEEDLRWRSCKSRLSPTTQTMSIYGGGSSTPATTFPELVKGGRFYCIRSTENRVFCVGSNHVGQLGRATASLPNAQFIAAQSASIPVEVTLPGDAKSIDAGLAFACAVVDESSVDEVYCWGENTKWQVGSTSLSQTTTPVKVDLSSLSGGRSITDIALGSKHACILSDGEVYCWGSDQYGQLGNGSASTSNQSTPVQVAGLPSGVDQISSGPNHTCAIANYEAYCWGDNRGGQLASDDYDQSTSAVAMTALGSNVLSIGGGDHFACSLHRDRRVRCWGTDNFGQLAKNRKIYYPYATRHEGFSQNISQLSFGRDTGCFIKNNGLHCFGRNDFGQLAEVNSTTTPWSVAAWTQIADPLPAPLDLDSGISKVVLGHSSVCTIQSGQLLCWGGNDDGSLGRGSLSPLSSTDIQAVSGLGANITDVAVGRKSACALDNTGAVSCWGDNDKYQLGLGVATDYSSVPTANPLGSGVQSIHGKGHSNFFAAVVDEGSTEDIYIWGSLIEGNGIVRVSPADYGLNAAPGAITSVDVGTYHACVAMSGGVRCVGYNRNAQLGIDPGTYLQSSTFIDVFEMAPSDGFNITKVSLGEIHSCALGDFEYNSSTVSGSVRCWGAGRYGQMTGEDWGGDSLGSFRSNLVMIDATTPLSDVQNIVSGRYHTCAIKTDGDVYCWGSDEYGAMGIQTTLRSTTPTLIDTWNLDQSN